MRKIPGALFVLLLLALAGTAQERPRENLIDVTAEGQFEADPDLAVLSFQVQGRDRDLRKAYAAAQQQADQVRDLLRRDGIPPQQTQLGNYEVQPNYDWRNRRLIDYTVATWLRLELNDFAKLGPLVEAAGQQGLPALSNISFELKNQDDAKGRAVASAYAKARLEADALARAAGARLGDLVGASIEMPEPIRPMPRMMAMATAAQAGPPPTAEFTPQRITVTAHVTATFRLLR
jgi:uncharacterized protein YggE